MRAAELVDLQSSPLLRLLSFITKTKSPLSFALQRARNFVLLANSAAHPRRRAMRVMAMMMVTS